MTTFDERERALEKKFALEQDRVFLARAHATKVIGEWAAKRLGLPSGSSKLHPIGSHTVRIQLQPIGHFRQDSPRS